MTPPTIIPRRESMRLSSRALDGLARRVIFRLLGKVQRGSLTLSENGQAFSFGEPASQATLQATVTVHHPCFYGSLLLAGSRGLGEAYVAGWWSADDLTRVIRIITLNLQLLEGSLGQWIRLAAPFYRFLQRPFRNTLAGSRANIAAHYDLGNDFYALFLDDTLTYSCGIFEREDSTLKEASLAKYDRICRKLALAPGDHVLEVGSGWGGFAIQAAGRYGCRVTTTTISQEQYDLARERIAAAGLTDRVTLLLRDYRHLEGAYDKLVSIEMIEAVGYEYWDTFFRACSERLKDHGLMCLQAITIADQVFDRYRRSYDFIRSHVFPGSCLTSVAAMTVSLARVTDLRLIHLEDLTPHYARTLRLWRERLFANLDKVRALGYPESFIRLWEFYLCYCEGGFAERYIGDVQMVLAKPKNRLPSILLPLTA
ncbi:MAG: cyclopropane-fatty-acyl-phospholipid synthase family protein [Desulfobaccales bacterium]